MKHSTYTILDDWIDGYDLLFCVRRFTLEELKNLIQAKKIKAYHLVKIVEDKAYCSSPQDKESLLDVVFSKNIIGIIREIHSETVMAADIYNNEKTLLNFINIYLDHVKKYKGNYIYEKEVKTLRCLAAVTEKDMSPQFVDNDTLLKMQPHLLRSLLSLRSDCVKTTLQDAWELGRLYLGFDNREHFNIDRAIDMLPKQKRGSAISQNLETRISELEKENDDMKSKLEDKQNRTAQANSARALTTAQKWAIQLERAVSLATECSTKGKPCSFPDHENMWVRRFGEPPLREALRAMRRGLPDDLVEGPR